MKTLTLIFALICLSSYSQTVILAISGTNTVASPGYWTTNSVPTKNSVGIPSTNAVDWSIQNAAALLISTNDGTNTTWTLMLCVPNGWAVWHPDTITTNVSQVFAGTTNFAGNYVLGVWFNPDSVPTDLGLGGTNYSHAIQSPPLPNGSTPLNIAKFIPSAP